MSESNPKVPDDSCPATLLGAWLDAVGPAPPEDGAARSPRLQPAKAKRDTSKNRVAGWRDLTEIGTGGFEPD